MEKFSRKSETLIRGYPSHECIGFSLYLSFLVVGFCFPKNINTHLSILLDMLPIPIKKIFTNALEKKNVKVRG
ncbi:MAG: hypothetical protein AB1779_00495, partial [Candidatus Thermoplasmatota archaeon]